MAKALVDSTGKLLVTGGKIATDDCPEDCCGFCPSPTDTVQLVVDGITFCDCFDHQVFTDINVNGAIIPLVSNPDVGDGAWVFGYPDPDSTFQVHRVAHAPEFSDCTGDPTEEGDFGLTVVAQCVAETWAIQISTLFSGISLFTGLGEPNSSVVENTDLNVNPCISGATTGGTVTVQVNP